MHGSLADLARVTAALDRDPFADPVTVSGIAMSRRDARRIERTLKAKFRNPNRATIDPSPVRASLPGPSSHSETDGPGLSSSPFHG